MKGKYVMKYVGLSFVMSGVYFCHLHVSKVNSKQACVYGLIHFFILILIHHFKIIDTGLQISQDSKNVWEVLQVILGTSVLILYYNISFQECFKRNHSSGFLRWSNIKTEESQMHSEFHLVGLENSKMASTSTV